MIADIQNLEKLIQLATIYTFFHIFLKHEAYLVNHTLHVLLASQISEQTKIFASLTFGSQEQITTGTE